MCSEKLSIEKLHFNSFSSNKRDDLKIFPFCWMKFKSPNQVSKMIWSESLKGYGTIKYSFHHHCRRKKTAHCTQFQKIVWCDMITNLDKLVDMGAVQFLYYLLDLYYLLNLIFLNFILFNTKTFFSSKILKHFWTPLHMFLTSLHVNVYECVCFRSLDEGIADIPLSIYITHKPTASNTHTT